LWSIKKVYGNDCTFRMRNYKASVVRSSRKKRIRCKVARNTINGREARKRSASDKFGQDVRTRNAQGTFGKPLACVTGIFDHVFSKSLSWIANKIDYTFDPPLIVRKGLSKDHVWRPKQKRSQVSKNGLYHLWSGWQRCIKRTSLMRVKDRQKRANVALTKPLTTHLTRSKGDFSCRVMNVADASYIGNRWLSFLINTIKHNCYTYLTRTLGSFGMIKNRFAMRTCEGNWVLCIWLYRIVLDFVNAIRIYDLIRCAQMNVNYFPLKIIDK